MTHSARVQQLIDKTAELTPAERDEFVAELSHEKQILTVGADDPRVREASQWTLANHAATLRKLAE